MGYRMKKDYPYESSGKPTQVEGNAGLLKIQWQVTSLR